MGIRVNGVAVVSVGVSCQATHQIENHATLIGELVGGKPKHVSAPFDWIICPARSAAGMIRDWRFHPSDPAELIDDQEPYWPQRHCWFWHDAEFLRTGDFLPRRDHLADNFDRLRQVERTIFILSNTQTNLDTFARSVRHPMEFAFTDEDLDTVEAALKSRFPNGELWIVAQKGRHALQRRRHDPRVIEFDFHASEWKGDYAQWSAALRRMLTPAT